MFTRIIVRKRYRPIFWDVAIVLGSICVAFTLAESHIVTTLLGKSQELGHLSSFLAGILFTSIFTTPISIAALSELSSMHGILQTALLAACGAVVGDLLIFHFVRDRFSEHLQDILSYRHPPHRRAKLFHYRFFRYTTFLIAGLIIASPLPDEIGIGLLGFSRIREVYFVPLSFGFNFLGVLIISALSSSIV